MARAKSTARAEARRRYRASQVAAEDADSVTDAADWWRRRAVSRVGACSDSRCRTGAGICAPFRTSCGRTAGGGSRPCCCSPSPIAYVIAINAREDAGGRSRSTSDSSSPRRPSPILIAGLACRARPYLIGFVLGIIDGLLIDRLPDGEPRARVADHERHAAGRLGLHPCRPRSSARASAGSRSSTRAGCRTHRDAARSSVTSRRRSRSARRATRLGRRAAGRVGHDRARRVGRLRPLIHGCRAARFVSPGDASRRARADGRPRVATVRRRRERGRAGTTISRATRLTTFASRWSVPSMYSNA